MYNNVSMRFAPRLVTVFSPAYAKALNLITDEAEEDVNVQVLMFPSISIDDDFEDDIALNLFFMQERNFVVKGGGEESMSISINLNREQMLHLKHYIEAALIAHPE